MEVKYIDHMGSDLSVVNAARVSFNKESEWEVRPDDAGDFDFRLSDRDAKLIQFLARGCTSGDWDALMREVVLLNDTIESIETLLEILNRVKKMPTHWTPFGHTAITLHIKAPIFVARQLGKHQVGFVWNEVSRRYVDEEPEFYVPEVWRGRSEDKKQGSYGEVDIESLYYQTDGWTPNLRSQLEILLDEQVETYKAMVESGVAPEQARMVLPQSMYTEWYWTGNLYGFVNVFIQRTDSHAQKEVRDVAHQIGEIIEPLFPVSWAALTGDE